MARRSMASLAGARLALRAILSLPTPVLRLMSGAAAVYRGGRTLDPRLQFLADRSRANPSLAAMTPEEARHSPYQHVLHKFLGCAGMPDGAEVFPFVPEVGDRLVLARLLVRRPPAGAGCDQPICIEWARATFALTEGYEPTVASGDRFVTWNSRTGGGCAEFRRPLGPRPWKPPPGPGSR